MLNVQCSEVNPGFNNWMSTNGHIAQLRITLFSDSFLWPSKLQDDNDQHYHDHHHTHNHYENLDHHHDLDHHDQHENHDQHEKHDQHNHNQYHDHHENNDHHNDYDRHDKDHIHDHDHNNDHHETIMIIIIIGCPAPGASAPGNPH